MKQIQMYYYNKLRRSNPDLAKTKQGRSMIMDEAVFMAKHGNKLKYANDCVNAAINLYKVLSAPMSYQLLNK